MLPIYQHHTQANVTVDFPTVDGESIAPTAVSFVVTDEVGSVIVDETELTLDPAAGTQVTIGVNPEFNIVPDDRTRAMRVVSMTFTAPTGRHTATARYVIEKASKLILMENSWQTYEEALLTRMDLPAFGVGHDRRGRPRPGSGHGARPHVPPALPLSAQPERGHV